MSDTISGTQDRILALAEELGALQESIALLEKQADAAKAPLEAAKATQDAAVEALKGAVEGLNAPKLQAFRSEIGSIKDEIRAALAEADRQIVQLQGQYSTIGDSFAALRAEFDQKLEGETQARVEFGAKKAAESEHNATEHAQLSEKIGLVREWAGKQIATILSRPTVTPEQIAEAVGSIKSELEAKFEAVKREGSKSVGLNPRGKYDEKQQYARMDLVEANGSSFIALTDGKKERPRKGKANIGWMVCAAGAGGGGSADAVLYTAQTLTTEQKAQARSNIGIDSLEGTGTVTSVSVTTANGVSGSVATATTTPAISLTLGAITPTSVAASGNVTGANLSGTNTGDNATNTQYSGLVSNATHTGDVTGSTALTIADAAVTLAKMANLAQDAFIIRTTASTGVPQTATCTAAARTVLDDTTVSAMLDTLGGASATGTGGVVRATSPTLVTPALGTPSSGTLTSCTIKETFGFALSDESTALTTGLKLSVIWPHASTITSLYTCVTTAPTGATLIVDVKEAGTTILSTKPAIDASEFDSRNGTAAVISDASIASGALVTFHIDQVGASVAGAGLKIFIEATRS